MIKIREWILPIFTVSEANKKEHWSKAKKRHDLQKKWIFLAFVKEKEKLPFPLHIKLTRIGKKKLDSDNLSVSLKWIRDSIADHIIPGLPPGKADDDPRISWDYDQTIEKNYGVIITFFQP